MPRGHREANLRGALLRSRPGRCRLFSRPGQFHRLHCAFPAGDRQGAGPLATLGRSEGNLQLASASLTQGPGALVEIGGKAVEESKLAPATLGTMLLARLRECSIGLGARHAWVMEYEADARFILYLEQMG